MIILSFNCIGFVSGSKKLALRALVKSYEPDVLMMQETLGVGDEKKGALNKNFPGWCFRTSDAKGRSGGLAMGIRGGRVKELNTWAWNRLWPWKLLIGALFVFITFECVWAMFGQDSFLE